MMSGKVAPCPNREAFEQRKMSFQFGGYIRDLILGFLCEGERRGIPRNPRAFNSFKPSNKRNAIRQRSLWIWRDFKILSTLHIIAREGLSVIYKRFIMRPHKSIPDEVNANSISDTSISVKGLVE